MLKYLAHLTAPVHTSFKADNHRGEPRWERNAVEALLYRGKTVHSTNRIWYSDEPKPDNLYDELHTEWLDESILISYGVPHEIHTGAYPPEADPKYRIIQYQDGPVGSKVDTFMKYHHRNPGSIVATCAFKSGDYLRRLQSSLGSENVEWTYGPTVPCVHENHDAFNQTNLLWAYRNFCKYADENPGEMRKLFGIVAGYMKDNPSLRLVILAQPHNEISAAALRGDKKSWFYSFPFTQELRPYFDRVDVFSALHWYEVLELMSKTKLVISPAEPLGGPPFELASYGVPIVLEEQTHPFMDGNGNLLFNGVLTAGRGFSNTFFNQMEQLFHNADFFNSHGAAYRSFVKHNATYDAYVNKLEEIASKRGWG